MAAAFRYAPPVALQNRPDLIREQLKPIAICDRLDTLLEQSAMAKLDLRHASSESRDRF